jgi:PTS system nitrogen regulatory IIA component
MPFVDILTPEAVIPALKASSKKHALQEISGFAADLLGMQDKSVFDLVMQRERVGTTGVGHGVAIPHGKIAGLDQIHGVFARLDKPLDFDAVDGNPVDLIFLLLAPEDAGADHLKALARVARALHDPELLEKVRACHNGDCIYTLLTEGLTSHNA